MRAFQNFQNRINYFIFEKNSIETKFIKGKIWSFFRFPIHFIYKKKWENILNKNSTEQNNSEFNSIIEERFRYLSNGIPKINTNIEIKTSELLQKNFENEILEDDQKKLKICKFIAKKLTHTNPNAALEFTTDAINLIEKLYGKYHPDLIDLNLQKSNLSFELGEIENSYFSINKAFLLTLLNENYYSFKMLNVIDHFRLFSLRIEETKEHEIFSQKMEKIINFLYARNKEDIGKNQNKLITLLYYKMKIIDGLIQCSKNLNNTISVENLKYIHSKYDLIMNDAILNEYLSIQSVSLAREDSSLLEMTFYIKYVNIKLRSIFKKDKKENLCNELESLIKDIKVELSPFSVSLIFPYILLIKITSTMNDLQIFDNLILNDWCDLLSTCFEENYLLISNYTFILIKELVFKEKDYKIKLTNFLNFVGENYESYFHFRDDPIRASENIFYADMCYIGAYLARDNPKLKPWEIASTSAQIYLNLLGISSEKYKNAMSLFETLDKKYNK